MEKPYNIVVLGSSRVGKTTLITNKRDAVVSTIGVDFFCREIQYENKKENIQFWDTSGQEIYNSICRNYYNKADCALLVFDLSNKDSWERAEKWFYDLREYDSDIGIVFIGNKADLVTELTQKQTADWVVMWGRAKELSETQNIKLLPCSAYNGDGVEECIIEAVKASRLKRKSKSVIERERTVSLNQPLLNKEKIKTACCN